MSVRTSGNFTAENWEENPLTAEAQSPGIAQAKVSNTYSGGVQAAGTTCAYVFTYKPDKTGSFVGFELLSGSLDGRAGSFVVEQRGTFDESGTVTCAFEVVAGSGTGELTALRGQGSYTARESEEVYPYTFDYEL